MFQKSLKSLSRVIIDISIIAVSYIAASNLRVLNTQGGNTSEFIISDQLIRIIGFIILIKLLVFYFTGIYKKFWRYTKTEDLIQVGRSLLIANLLIVLPRIVLGLSPKAHDLFAVSYGVMIIDFFLSVTLICGVRLLRFYLKEQSNIKSRLKVLSSKTKNTLIIGAGEGGMEVLQAIKNHPELGLDVKGVLDDDSKKFGMSLLGSIQVKGAIVDVQYWVDELAIEQIIIAIPSSSLKERKRISLLCNSTGVDVRIVPSVDQLAGGNVDIREIRKLSMEDLLGREEINLNIPEVVEFLKDKKVLVTGAGGSIGRELCKQLLGKGQIKSLCLLGKGENSIFESRQELERMKHLKALESIQADELNSHKINTEIIARIADIRNYSRIEHIIKEFKPEIIFHAAAHKHVVMMEENPCEAFENNVLGSKNLMELAAIHGVENFVLISTDKAVNPTSIMGKTKRLAEKLLLIHARKFTNTKYTAVRFGNVLGSRGSVIKIWEKQIEEGKSITVTDKEAIRYFMTIPEASQLVIKAASKAHSGEIMILDMGEPINIYELAKQFIQLSGLSLADVDIEFTGMRAGEKLYEELLTSEEFVASQLTDKIFKAKIEEVEENALMEQILELSEMARVDNQGDLVRSLSDGVLERR
ncbi:MAG: nucleoside-diphosphate sugar epimerase/dehydratase [Candidatus Melainabacteria bacterium]|nr:nucleoside-diphosphate sugar epimerase/dehydratase [Candidatus Melainabacteria bacterium]